MLIKFIGITLAVALGNYLVSVQWKTVGKKVVNRTKKITDKIPAFEEDDDDGI